ncbi:MULTISPECIES: DeoD-type purine-nucleoside phosphorylase [Herbiconiux]|jgi:purine-nucleoside phosphorylase|uniref:Uridine phosphorylase n=1 Tax=Herbiconiux flava TaxID=881268 RepID=A0A852SMV4_9MICO|nr:MULTISPECIES: purine-nucleoside phosphorylase [Herbiconiux]MBF4571542.1 purine-nucleoside phosphorylase [Herbiconiux sp. VKM Ac-1786]NQX35996.1 purine-nucleoside phosphorylase [Herbiconiux sp. VKM Ac-2851]NYD70152.1 purine-nucleoside phosphorylase [Herbiconiux flava]GLK16904.1 purine nucleoside phosphorylase DeoD-type [Herbiconiux flava]
MPTPHIGALDGDFAPDVLMPGDPRRAKLIAETFFDSPRLVTEVRGILGYTGTFEGRPVSVLASGMGIPSMSIYSTELARHYGVKRIVRVGTIGGIAPYLELGDVIAASAAHTNSAMTSEWVPGVTLSHAPSFGLLRKAVEFGEATGKRMHVGPLFTTDAFYNPDVDLVPRLLAYGTIGIDMEAAGLYAVALKEGFESLMVGTVSDLPGSEMTAAEREATFENMVSFGLAALA